MNGGKVMGIIFGVLVIINALVLFKTAVSVFAILTFVLAGISIIASAMRDN